MTPEEYNEAKLALKGLIAKDPDSGNAEVMNFLLEEKERRNKFFKGKIERKNCSLFSLATKIRR